MMIKQTEKNKNGQTVFLCIRPSNCVFEKTIINKDRTKLSSKERRAKA